MAKRNKGEDADRKSPCNFFKKAPFLHGYRETACQSLADEYRRTVNPDFFVHAVDLQGYGTQQFIGRNTNIIAGWSEKVLPFIGQVEKGLESMTEAIGRYEI